MEDTYIRFADLKKTIGKVQFQFEILNQNAKINEGRPK